MGTLYDCSQISFGRLVEGHSLVGLAVDEHFYCSCRVSLSRGTNQPERHKTTSSDIALYHTPCNSFIPPARKEAICRDKSNRHLDTGSMFTDKSLQSLKRNTELDLICETERKCRKRSTRSGRGQLVHTSVRDLSSRNSWHEGTWFTAAAQSASPHPTLPHPTLSGNSQYGIGMYRMATKYGQCKIRSCDEFVSHQVGPTAALGTYH
jgi:hypothetical protein